VTVHSTAGLPGAEVEMTKDGVRIQKVLVTDNEGKNIRSK